MAEKATMIEIDRITHGKGYESILCVPLYTVPNLIPTLNVRAARAYYTTATQFPWRECMDDLSTERRFDPQALWAIAVICDFLSYDMIIYRFLYKKALTDVRSIGAGIKSLYCISNQRLCGRHGQ